MPVIGRGDDDGVNIFTVEQLPVLRKIRRDLAFGALFCAVEVSLVAIADFHEIGLLGFFGGLEQMFREFRTR